jgi:hypothetical protein
MNTRGTHPLNVSYLVVGLVFLGLATSWALREADVIDLGEVRWLFPLTLVLAGVVGIVAMALKGRTRRDSEPAPDNTYSSTHDSYEGEER